MKNASSAGAKTGSSVDPHLIAQFQSDSIGPTLIAVGSIHGNEPSGRLALERVAKRLEPLKEKLRGSVYFLVGNIAASERSVRFVDADLNRHWKRENIRKNTHSARGELAEDHEQHILLSIFRKVISLAIGEVFVLDLHSTSAGGAAFATLGDTLRNRHFAQKLPVTILLGIEEQLEGTMLEFLNNEGAVTLGFEAGQHASSEAIDNHEALVVLSLVNAGILRADDFDDLDILEKRLAAAAGRRLIVEVRHREAVKPDDEFRMYQEFRNFDPVKTGTPLAENRNGIIRSPETGMILMPLYQPLGEDGFFIVRRVAPFWLKLSELLRRLRIADYVHLLPGVRRHPKQPETLHIDTRIARFFPLQVFHLLGFRRLRWRSNFLIVTRRRFDITSPFDPAQKAIRSLDA